MPIRGMVFSAFLCSSKSARSQAFSAFVVLEDQHDFLGLASRHGRGLIAAFWSFICLSTEDSDSGRHNIHQHLQHAHLMHGILTNSFSSILLRTRNDARLTD